VEGFDREVSCRGDYDAAFPILQEEKTGDDKSLWKLKVEMTLKII